MSAFERRRPARKPFPEHLPRERVVVETPTCCACCGSSRIVKLGEDITETLEVVPRQWKVVQTVREKFTCRDCEKISQPPAPFHATPRGWAGPNLGNTNAHPDCRATISARQLGRQLGLGSYKSAWLLCAKLRRAMVNPDRSPLSGLVEVDETQIACRTKDDPVAGGGGRSPDGKMQVIVAVAVIDKTAPGRLRLGTIKDASAASQHPFIKANVAEGATLKTDGWSAYPGVPGYTHEPHVVGKMAAHVVLPWVHRVIANLKVWAMGVYHGRGESTSKPTSTSSSSRFNRRAKPLAAFRTLLGIGVAIKPATYKMLIKPEAQG